MSRDFVNPCWKIWWARVTGNQLPIINYERDKEVDSLHVKRQHVTRIFGCARRGPMLRTHVRGETRNHNKATPNERLYCLGHLHHFLLRTSRCRCCESTAGVVRFNAPWIRAWNFPEKEMHVAETILLLELGYAGNSRPSRFLEEPRTPISALAAVAGRRQSPRCHKPVVNEPSISA